MKNYKFINEWLTERGISLAVGFAPTLRKYADEYGRKNGLKLCEVYSLLGCSKQNVSYWDLHGDSTQSKHSVLSVIRQAAKLFELSGDDAEALANSAGLSLMFEGGDLIEYLGYKGRKCDLCRGAVISERMLRYYKKNADKASFDRHRGLFKITRWRDRPLVKTVRLLSVGKLGSGYGDGVVYEVMFRA